VRNFAEHGITVDIGEPLPELAPVAEQAIACWNFCAGWAPERWLLYAALHPVDDWYAVMDLMRVIGDRHHELDEQERKARS
jgi:hypothetical protein